jgi:DNA-binding winged helix-turn-helix (wHTH) protein
MGLKIALGESANAHPPRGHTLLMPLYSFNNFSLDPDRRELRSGASAVPVEPQVFDLLLCLIRNRDRVVSYDDLIAQVWNGRIVSDSTLATRINAARKAIGDDGARQALIKTTAKKGVRFIGDVRENDGATPRANPGKPLRQEISSQARSGRRYLHDSPTISLLSATTGAVTGWPIATCRIFRSTASCATSRRSPMRPSSKDLRCSVTRKAPRSQSTTPCVTRSAYRR